jgi:hypothetical protein
MASGIVPTALSVVSDILSTAATVTRIDILPALVAHVPLTVLLVGHCLAIAGLTRGRYTGALLSFVQVSGEVIFESRLACASPVLRSKVSVPIPTIASARHSRFCVGLPCYATLCV